MSLIVLTNGLRKALGDVEVAKVLRDGSLFLKCKNAGQRDKAVKLQSICKKEIAGRKRVGRGSGARGVISGIPLGENLEELKKIFKGEQSMKSNTCRQSERVRKLTAGQC